MRQPFVTRIESYNNIVTHFMSDGTYKETSIVYILDRIAWLEDQHKRLHKEVEELEIEGESIDSLLG